MPEKEFSGLYISISGKPCTNRMTDYYCLYYAKDFCQEDWAQKECPVTCNACGTKTGKCNYIIMDI